MRDPRTRSSIRRCNYGHVGVRVLAIKEATKQCEIVKVLETYQVWLFFTSQIRDNLLLQLGQAMLLGAGGQWCSIFGVR